MSISDQVKRANPVDIPMVETEYGRYLAAKNAQYLKPGGWDGLHYIDDKVEYLSWYGFVRGVDKLASDVGNTLSHIDHNFGFRLYKGLSV